MWIQRIICIIFIGVGIYQIYRTGIYFNALRTKGNQSTSPFSPLALYSGFIIGVIFVIVGITTFFF